MSDTWVEFEEPEEFEHDEEPMGSDEDMDPEGYDPDDDPASQPPTTPSVPPTETGSKGPGGVALPVANAAIPAWVKEHGNGQVPVELMTKVAPIWEGYLVPEAAAAWRNLQNAASAAGFALTMTGAFRTYDRQVALFKERYVTSNTGRKSKTWNGTQYWLKPGMAMAAVPGTSNHGWGCAVDAALGGYGGAAQPVGEPFLSWALEQAHGLGWSWEVQSEPWHLRLVAFQSIPQGRRSAAGPVAPRPTLARESKGGQVAALQNLCLLFKWGDVGKADGEFGERTEAAVKAMQTALEAKPDGRYGPKSAERLGAFLSSMAALAKK
jgi:peptidoglycan hydrolase-like protein with peptidoglycan-binding domain